MPSRNSMFFFCNSQSEKAQPLSLTANVADSITPPLPPLNGHALNSLLFGTSKPCWNCLFISRLRLDFFNSNRASHVPSALPTNQLFVCVFKLRMIGIITTFFNISKFISRCVFIKNATFIVPICGSDNNLFSVRFIKLV